ncbi:hypothetical protein GIB67_006086 [Kingdonia uniflora]|uniref:RanBP2-type domain-containing protein n=1 Tax=Kingdonia uniflora TaxID=39325 RepID=A0A7J7LQ20_9MAGN|nr:hypothetical protein GIB67_006086 [Kingdonia uniflora]
MCRCQFLNFARNRVCMRCSERRPKRQLEYGEWECPSCDYLNFRRNMSCNKCKCERPNDTALQYEDAIWSRPS